jgi:hypothetical protein
MCVCIVRTSKQRLFFIALFINYVQVLSAMFLSVFLCIHPTTVCLSIYWLFTSFVYFFFLVSFLFVSRLFNNVPSLHCPYLYNFVVYLYSSLRFVFFVSAISFCSLSFRIFLFSLCSFPSLLLYFFVSFCSCPHGVSEQYVQTCQQVDKFGSVRQSRRYA